MSASPFEPGPALARISRTPIGFVVDCRSRFSAQHYDFKTEGETAEFAHLLAREGGWSLRYSTGAADIEALVDELSEGGVE